jgi:ribosomal protein S15P/S13E
MVAKRRKFLQKLKKEDQKEYKQVLEKLHLKTTKK